MITRRRSRPWQIILRRLEWLLWGALAVWGAVRVAPQASAWVGIGEPSGSAPVIELRTLDGSTVGEPEVRGRVIVLSFWASWCLPCRVEMPTLEALHREYADDGLLVVGLAMDAGDVRAVREFLEEEDITFPIAEPTFALRSAFGGIGRLPTTVLIDRNGLVRHRVVGLFAPPALRAAVRRLLGES